MAASKDKFLDDIEIEDVDAYRSGGDTFGYRHIVMKAYQKCVEEGSKEMTTGGLIKRFIDGEEIIVDAVPNQIEIFINSVRMLRNLLFPKMELKPNMSKRLNNCEIKLKMLKRDYNNAIKQVNMQFLKKSRVISPDGISERDSATLPRGNEINRLKDDYAKKQLVLYREELFPYLSMLLNEFNYFEEV